MKPTKSVLNGKNINLTGDNTIITSNNFNVDKDGNMSCTNAKINGTITSNNANITGGKIHLLTQTGSVARFIIGQENDGVKIDSYFFQMGDDNNIIQMSSSGAQEPEISVSQGWDYQTRILATGIETPVLTQTSLQESKKNFEKLQDNALNILKTIDIYKYNLKNEKDTDKKHIGFVIGDNFNYSKEVTSIDNKGVDNYSFTSLCCKAIQELSTKVEELEKEIKELKEKEEK